MEKLRSLVRPILTLSGWFVLLYLAITTNGEIKTFFLGALTTMLGFWFAERLEEHRKTAGEMPTEIKPPPVGPPP